MSQFPFEFEIDAHTKAGAVRGWRGGNDFAVPSLNASAAALLVTSAALAANATFTGTTCDRFAIGAGGTPTETPVPVTKGIFVTKYRGIAFSDQPGTLYVEESNDGNTWTQTNTTVVSANAPADTGWVYLSKRYYRLRYVNGATAQTQFSLLDSAGAGLADVNASLTGSNVTIVQGMNAVVIPVSSGASYEFDVTNVSEIRFWVSATSTYTLSGYPKYTNVGDDTNLPATGSQALATNVAAPASNRTNSYLLNNANQPFAPAKSYRVNVSNTDVANPNTVSLWVATRSII